MKEVANFANDSTDRLREMQTRGVQNPENFANVMNGCSLWVHRTLDPNLVTGPDY